MNVDNVTAEEAKELNTKAYGIKMQQAREGKGLSQTQAGRHLHKARETLSLLERGLFTYAPFPKEMAEFEELYGIPQLEQLSTLGYEVKAVVLEGAGELSAMELNILNSFRAMNHRDQRVCERMIMAFSVATKEENGSA